MRSTPAWSAFGISAPSVRATPTAATKMDKSTRQNADLAERSAEAAAELADQAAALLATIEAFSGGPVAAGSALPPRRDTAPVAVQPSRATRQPQHRRIAAAGRMGM